MAIKLDRKRIQNCKWAFTTRRIDRKEPEFLLTSDDLGERPLQSGDLVLAIVERVGHHKRLEGRDGRKSQLYEGDEIIVVLGARYAPDQFEALVPAELGVCHLAAGRGVAANVVKMHDRIIRPTQIRLLGLLASTRHNPINLRDFGIAHDPIWPSIPAIGVIGTAMNSGKTTSAVGMIRGLTKAGYLVGAIKVTGTGSGGDFWSYVDAGVYCAADFTDTGFVSTYLQPIEELEQAARALIKSQQNQGCDVVIVEISDGIGQRESALLLERPVFKQLLPTMVFTASDSAGALYGLAWLKAHGYHVPFAAGLFTRSPLALEEFGRNSPVPCRTLRQLCDADIAGDLLAQTQLSYGLVS